jgi:hypothetical protein
MWTHANVWMKSVACLMLTLPVTGCMTGASLIAPSGNAICDDTRKIRTDHAAALAADGGPTSILTGQTLIAKVDAGCRS